MLPDELLVDNPLFFMEVRRMLSRNHSVTVRAKGNSMFPFILDGCDEVVLHRSTDIKAGDIVLAELQDSRYVLHRVYRVQGDRVMLMGDGNLQATESCQKENIVGTVVQIIRGGRFVDCTSKAAYRRAALWRRLLPVRRYLLYVLRLCKGHDDRC